MYWRVIYLCWVFSALWNYISNFDYDDKFGYTKILRQACLLEYMHSSSDRTYVRCTLNYKGYREEEATRLVCLDKDNGKVLPSIFPSDCTEGRVREQKERHQYIPDPDYRPIKSKNLDYNAIKKIVSFKDEATLFLIEDDTVGLWLQKTQLFFFGLSCQIIAKLRK